METLETNQPEKIKELLKELPNDDVSYWKQHYNDQLNSGMEMSDLIKARYLRKLEIIKEIEGAGQISGLKTEKEKSSIVIEKTAEEKERKISELENKIKEVRDRIAEIKKIQPEETQAVIETETQLKENEYTGPKIVENLSAQQIEKNKETIDSIFDKKDKNVLAEETHEEEYGNKARDLVLDETEKEEYGVKIKKVLRKITPKFRKKFFALAGAGAIFLAANGFTKDEDGQLHYSYKKAVSPLVKTAMSALKTISPVVEAGLSKLSEEEKQYAIRGLWKYGYDAKEDIVQYKRGEKMRLKNKTDSLARVSETQKAEKHKEYLEENTYFDELEGKRAVDYRASNKGITRELIRCRNQWANENGCEYLATPNKENMRGRNFTYGNVKGVAHFLLDADVTINQKHTEGTNDSNDHYLHPNDIEFIKIAKEKNQYLPVFQRIKENYILLRYKKANEIDKNDEIMSPLRQLNFDDIDFNKFQQPSYFQSDVKEVILKPGIKNPYAKNGSGTHLIFANGNKKAYGPFSGASVVFIFNDKQGNRFVRDFAGSVYDIEQEGKSIEKEFSLEKGDLVIGMHDVGSFAAKPAAENGKISTSQWAGMNPGKTTGASILYVEKF